jgi:hypothetical protein
MISECREAGLLHSSREQEIRNRAFEIYLQRGGEFGYELCVPISPLPRVSNSPLNKLAQTPTSS